MKKTEDKITECCFESILELMFPNLESKVIVKDNSVSIEIKQKG